MIQMKNLSLEQGGTKILHNINLQIRTGEFVFLIGKSGAGKSSFLDIIQGKRPYHNGSLRISDKELASFSFQELQTFRNQMGSIPQDNALIEEWTVFDNLSYKLEYNGYAPELIREKIQEWTTLLGVTKHLKNYPGQLSGGEQQRVNIVRGLLHQPQLVIADESTANLDEENAQIVFNLLKQLNQNGTTVLMATHNPHIIESSNFRVVKFVKGAIHHDQISSSYFV